MKHKPDERQEGLVDHGEDLGEGHPLVYLGVPLSQLEEDRREKVEFLAHTVNRAIYEETRCEPDAWPVRVHSPVKHSAPWREDVRTPEEIYQLNTGKIWLEGDALIVIAEGGGSLGIGQELAWACGLQLPVLVVHKDRSYVSRQAKGTSHEYDVTIEAYGDPDHLEDIVRAWMVSRRQTICDGPRRRLGRKVHLNVCCARLSTAWEGLSEEGRRHVAAVTRMAVPRIERMLSEPQALAAASVQEIVALGGALRIDAWGQLFAKPLPTLRPQQRAALNAAAREFGWDFEKSLRVYSRARRELANGGIRRLPLGTNRDWAEFAARYDL